MYHNLLLCLHTSGNGQAPAWNETLFIQLEKEQEVLFEVSNRVQPLQLVHHEKPWLYDAIMA